MKKITNVTRGYVTVGLAAQILNQPENSIRHLLNSGKLKGRKRKQGIVSYWEVNIYSVASYR